MPDLTKLDNAIKELDETSKEIKSIKELYLELMGLQEKINENSKLLLGYSDNLLNTTNEINNRLKKYDDFLKTFDARQAEISQEIEKLKKETINFLQDELKRYDQFFVSFNSKQTEISNSIDNFKNDIYDLLRKEFNNVRELQKLSINELDDSLKTRLDKNKSDIEVVIRNEGMQIQRGFENSLNQNFLNLSKEINYNFEALKNIGDKTNSSLKSIKTFCYIIVFVIIVATLFIKYF